MRWKPLLLVGLLSATSALAQGTILDTWHGNSGYFQASFQAPPEENQPGQYFNDGTFRSTFIVVSPDTHQLWAESGYWTYAPIPEPSSASLLTLGAIGWFGLGRRL